MNVFIALKGTHFLFLFAFVVQSIIFGNINIYYQVGLYHIYVHTFPSLDVYDKKYLLRYCLETDKCCIVVLHLKLKGNGVFHLCNPH